MKVKFIAFDLAHGITLTMPKKAMTDDVIKAFLLLGGLLYHGYVRTEADKARIRMMMDDCFDYIKKGDFSKLAKEAKHAIVFEKEVNEA